MIKKRESYPADGERNAISGYDNQFIVVASLIMEALLKRSLTYIRIADPHAGRVDDFQIEQSGRLDAYQIKWSRLQSNFTFTDLIKSTQRDQQSILKQLADGWKKLKGRYPNNHVVVHLISNDISSTYRYKDNPGLAFFIAEVWNPIHEGKDVPEKWKIFWEEIRKETGFSEEEFFEFAKSCEFNFGWNNSLPNHLFNPQREADIQHIKATLLSLVASPEYIIELSHDELLKKLNWQDRFELRSRHEFPSPKMGFCEITETVQSIKDAIETCNSGYLALLGPPGAGKSTLVQKLFFDRHRIIRYYSYIPESYPNNLLRGESITFLHDMVLLLQDHGVYGNRQFVTYERERLYSILESQIEEAHQDYQKTQRKTIIIIDGLDHIPREQNPQRSLLKDLLPPNNIPDGILFLLSTQSIKLDDISTNIKNHLDENRTFRIKSIPRNNVIDWLSKRFSTLLSQEQIQKIFELTNGHPLSINLLLNQIQQITSQEAVDKILRESTQYDDNILNSYSSHWNNEIDKQRSLREEKDFLGKISRLRNGFDKELLKMLANNSDKIIKHFLEIWQRYFLYEDEKWIPFHNSICLFLIKKTSEDSFGDYLESKDKQLHSDIASILKKLPETNQWRWEITFHLCESGQYNELLKLITTDNIILQTKQFRPIVDIQEEIQLGFRACLATNSAEEFVRILFVMLDLEMRIQYLDDYRVGEVVPALLKFIKYDRRFKDIVLKHIIRGRSLALSKSQSFIVSRDLFSMGHKNNAKKIYFLAEPCDILNGYSDLPYGFQDYQDILVEWAQTAPLFREFDEIKLIIQNLDRTPWAQQIQAENNNNNRVGTIYDIDELKACLFFHAGTSYINNEQITIAEEILTIIENQKKPVWLYWYIKKLGNMLAKTDTKKSEQYESRAMSIIEQEKEIPFSCLLDASKYAFFILKDEKLARKFFERTECPKLEIFNGSYTIDSCFEYFQLFCTFNKNIDECNLVPAPDNESLLPLVLFERALLLLANIKAKQNVTQTITPLIFLHEIKKLINVFQNIDTLSDRYSSMKNEVFHLRPRFFEMILETASDLGMEFVTEVANYFFYIVETSEDFLPFIALQLLRKLWDIDFDQDFCRLQIKKMANQIFDINIDQDTYLSYVDDFITCMAEFGEIEYAQTLLMNIVQNSFSIANRKDHQLENWIKWLEKANTEFPKDAEERIRFITKCILLLKNADEIYDAASLLIEAAYQWKPEASLRIVFFLAKNGVISLPSGLQVYFEMSAKDTSVNPKLLKILLCNILMPICSYGNSPICENLLKRIDDRQTAENLVHELKESILTLTPAIAREKWLDGIREFLPHEQTAINRESQHIDSVAKIFSENIPLISGKKLSMEDFISQATTIEKFIDLIKQIEKGYDFYLNKWFRKWIATFTTNQIKWVQKELSFTGYYSLQILCLEKLERLVKQDESSEVFDAAKNLFMQSDSLNILDSDHQSRAAEIMIRQNPSAAYPIIFESLVENIKLRSDRVYLMAIKLEYLLKFFKDSIDSQTIWTIIESYLSQIVNSKTVEDVILYDKNKISTANETLIQLLDHFIDSPLNLLSAGSIKSLYDMFIETIPEIYEKFKYWISSGNENIIRSCLVVLQGIHPIPNSLLQLVIHKDLQNLTSSCDIDIRTRTTEILEKIGISDMLLSPPDTTCFPELYAHQPLLDSKIHLTDKKISSTSFLEDSFDPRKIIGLYKPVIQTISTVTKIPYENLLSRIHKIMRELENESQWNQKAEMDFREQCENMQINFTFRRLRTQIVYRSILHLIGELMDWKKLSQDSAKKIYSSFLRIEDHNAIGISPSIRPPSIILPVFPSKDNNVTWIQHNLTTQEKTNFFAEKIDDWCVLAEHTSWRGTTRFEEIRQSALVPHNVQHIIEQNQKPFVEVKQIFFEEYWESIPSDLPPALVIKNISFDLRFLISNWLAFNPNVAQKLGLEPVKDKGIFCWKYSNDIVIRSIYWMDGHPHFLPRDRDDECPLGIGWVVIIKESFLKHISDTIGKPMQFCFFSRCIDHHGENPNSKLQSWTKEYE